MREMNSSQPKSLIILALIFTLFLAFLTIVIPLYIDNLLLQLFPDIHPIFYPDEIKVFINVVKPIGYISLTIIVLFIVLGFLIKYEKISVSSSFLLFLPTYGNFVLYMFFLAGFGILQVVWLPLDTPFFNFLTLGNIVFLPLLPISTLTFGVFPYVVMIIGLSILTSGVISWFYGKYQKKEIFDLFIYKYSRHPQYLGFLIWSYGVSLLYITFEAPTLIEVAGKIGLSASLPWVIFALIIGVVAFLEDIRLAKDFPDKYQEYRKNTPFLIKLPKSLKPIITFPLRHILNKDFPETKKDVFKVVLVYGMIIVILSLLILLIFPKAFQ
jgi:protein-S-isoprenylcysteine O-methyltransferase Ste14